MNYTRLYACLTVGLLLPLTMPTATLAATKSTDQATPRLVVLIVVDQLRADLPLRYQHHFSAKGGLHRFIHDGIYYRQSHYTHTSTSTAPGHATIATGAVPADHGIVANRWFDRQTGSEMQAVTDPQERSVGEAEGFPGASPRRLKASTLADELLAATDSEARVFAVSAKDRGSVFTAGFAGKAFWYSTYNGHFVSSSYYYAELPAWVQALNNQGLTRYPNQWGLALPAQSYRQGVDDNRLSERPRYEMERTFPHPLGDYNSTRFFGAFKRTPFVDELTVEYALALIKNEGLGSDAVSDFLSVSLSATDYVGHAFGPESREAEDNLIRLDATIGRLIDGVEAQVGKRNVVFALTADHGVGASPEYKLAQGLPAYRINAEELLVQMNQHLRGELKVDTDLVLAVLASGIYINHVAVETVNQDIARVTDSALAYLRARPEVAIAVVPANIDKVSGYIGQLLRNNTDPDRAGDILIIEKPSAFFGTAAEAAAHGSPYAYDTHVPAAFLMPQRRGQMVFRRVSQTAIAPTLAQLLNISAPTNAYAPVLKEVLDTSPRAR